MIRIHVCLILTLFVLCFARPGYAQEAASGQEAAVSDAEQLLDTLKDDGKREAFISQLEAFIAAKKATAAEADPSLGEVMIATVSDKMDAFGRQLAAMARDISDIPELAASAGAFLSDAEKRNRWLLLAGQLLLIFVAGIVAERIAHGLLRRTRASIENQEPDGWSMRLFFPFVRALLDLVAVASFLAGAYVTMALVAPVPSGRTLALALINASVLARIVLTVSNMCLAPRVAGLRLLPLGDETANYTFIWIRRLVYFLAYGYFLVGALPALGVSEAVYTILAKLIGLVTAAMLVVLVMQVRGDVAEQIRGGSTQIASQLRHRFADIWHLIAILYVIAIFGVWALEVPGGFDFVLRSTVLSVVVIAAAFTLSLLIKKGLRKVFSISAEQNARFPGLEARANRYLPVLIATARGILFAAALLAVLRIWGVDAIGWIATPTGAIIAKSVVNIVVIVVVALLIWEMISFAIERYLVTGGKDGSPSAGGQRALTLLPLLRTAVLITLAILVTLTVLSELGVDIAPLIAGAGIIGLAVGFGAQTFVKDVITGLFILIEDSVAVGDLVVLGGYRGKVESMSLRSIQLRDLQGDVHRIPFSEVTSTTNRSKVFSFAFFDIGIAYREDVDHCMNVIREVGAEMQRDENFASMITENIEIMGVQSFDDSAVIIRARFKVLPGKQLGVQRAFNRLLKNRFDAEGIEIPFPHRTIYFGVDGQGNAPSAHVQIHEPTLAGEKRPKATLSQAPEGERADFDEEPTIEEKEKDK